jgi:hypothetical protein
MLLLVLAVVEVPQSGWASATPISYAGAAVLLVVFYGIERRSQDPLLRLGIFRSAALRRANLGAMVLFGTFISFLVILGW